MQKVTIQNMGRMATYIEIADDAAEVIMNKLRGRDYLRFQKKTGIKHQKAVGQLDRSRISPSLLRFLRSEGFGDILPPEEAPKNKPIKVYTPRVEWIHLTDEQKLALGSLKGQKTCAAAASLCGVSDERIRQIINNPPKKIRSELWNKLMTI